jgi:hypothetical protein
MNLAYILGAGASAGVIPPVNGFTDDILVFLQTIVKDEIYQLVGNNLLNDKNAVEALVRVKTDGLALVNEAKAEASIDVFAKHLHLVTREKDLHLLKSIVSAYLFYKQAQGHKDNRYSSLFAKLFPTTLPRPFELPKELIIITWNYDAQIEKAIYKLTGNLENVLMSTHNSSKGNVFHMNGIGAYNDESHFGDAFEYILKGSSQPEPGKVLEMSIKYLGECLFCGHHSAIDINYAWENITNNRSKAAIQKTKDLNIDTLVCIGYSFPDFNRDIDEQLIGNMDRLKEIYLQFPGTNKSVEERLKEMGVSIPVQYRDPKDFFIPRSFFLHEN